jgi:hypothetical protein
MTLHESFAFLAFAFSSNEMTKGIITVAKNGSFDFFSIFFKLFFEFRQKSCKMFHVFMNRRRRRLHHKFSASSDVVYDTKNEMTVSLHFYSTQCRTR